MTSQAPLNEEALEVAVTALDALNAYSLNVTLADAAEVSIRAYLAAVPADTVNSVDDLEVGSLIKDDTGQLFWKAWRTGGPSLHWLDDEGQPATPAFPATVLYRPEASDA